ncbi:hypothetical protein M514_13190 [Trichuris suis]|uniref:Uncharacterized protein n=1 Tax=Trichuris suis TaxID=68888 RepID=A0A085N4E6_9BILA|nr:hypothetical protein M514_13190 [Trichuris suis]
MLTHPLFLLTAANGSYIKTFGKLTLTTDFGLGRTFKWSFICADVTGPIISTDFLFNFVLMVDIKRRKLIDITTSNASTGVVLPTVALGLKTINPSSSRFQKLLADFPSLTRPQFSKAKLKRDITHHIITQGPPKAVRPRRLAPDKLKAAKAEFDILLNQCFSSFPPPSPTWTLKSPPVAPLNVLITPLVSVATVLTPGWGAAMSQLTHFSITTYRFF